MLLYCYIDFSILMQRNDIQLEDVKDFLVLSFNGKFSIGYQTHIPIGAYSLLPNPGLNGAGVLLESTLRMEPNSQAQGEFKPSYLCDAVSRLEPSTPRAVSECPNNSTTELPFPNVQTLVKETLHFSQFVTSTIVGFT